MAVTAALVKELRELTGAGMMDCKKALVETDGNIEQAVDVLREKGLSKAAKKAGRIAAMGLVDLAFNEDATEAAIIEVNSETDFVAKNPDFQGFVKRLADLALNGGAADMDAFMALNYGEEGTVQEALTSKISTIGENMNIRRFEKVAVPGTVNVGYIHCGGTIAVIVTLKTDASAEEVQTVGKDVAMQIAAMNPAYLDQASVPEDVINHEKGILAAQMKEDPKMASKPEQVLIKIAEGKMGKYYKENCLVEQEFVRSDLFQGNVKGYVDSVAKALGCDIKINGFIRMMKGEGLEKREENFAEEIAKQING